MTNPEIEIPKMLEQKTRSQRDLDNWLAYTALTGTPRIMGPGVREYPHQAEHESDEDKTISVRRVRFTAKNGIWDFHIDEA